MVASDIIIDHCEAKNVIASHCFLLPVVDPWTSPVFLNISGELIRALTLYLYFHLYLYWMLVGTILHFCVVVHKCKFFVEFPPPPLHSRASHISPHIIGFVKIPRKWGKFEVEPLFVDTKIPPLTINRRVERVNMKKKNHFQYFRYLEKKWEQRFNYN